MSLALWLRAGRAHRGMSLEQVAKVTKIQQRILERLESGKLDGLPADVFVRGFVRSVAKCVGLDEAEALRRYAACANGGISTAAPVAARAVVEAMADLAPGTARAAAPKHLGAISPVQLDEISPDEIAAGSLQNLPAATAVEASISEPAVEEPVVEAAAPSVEAPIAAPAAPDAEAEAVAADAEAAAPATGSKKKRGRRGGKGRNKRKGMANGTPAEATPVVQDEEISVAAAEPVAPVEVISEPAATPAIEVISAEVISAEAISAEAISPEVTTEPAAAALDDEPIATATWQPKMPPITQSAPWRRPRVATSALPVVPSLVIDDADPESAEQEIEERAAAKSVLTNAQRRSFLPPILLDREDRSGRQGGLTLAVILLLIAATLTLSYLMRRPSSSGDGVTQVDAPSLMIG
ncbi:MAG: helix-turn-helix domain-containing protein [Kofleriaceae bacterium]